MRLYSRTMAFSRQDREYHKGKCGAPANVENIRKNANCLHNFIRTSLPARRRYYPSSYIDNEDALDR